MTLPAGEARPRPRIGRYVVTGRIGRGGMGMVYRGYDEVLEREVAIKTLTAEGQLDQESRRRFEIEAKAAARLQHPNILTVFELGEDRGVPFIAMELLPGVDLDQLMRSGEPLLLQEKLDIVIQVCRGLQYAHEHRIVHRDIKPSNIRILDDGTAKIMDFGIAKLGGTHVTKSGMMVGTVHYMSPEQIRGQTLDGRSDVFSLGVILYELLAGKRPFAGREPTEVLYKIVHDPAPPIGGDLGVAGERLQEVMARALAKDPDARHPSAGRLADELGSALAAHTRAAAALAPEGMEVLNLGRRLLKEGRVEESQRRLRDLADAHPDSLDARRALRAATRELARRQRAPERPADEFPELDATFQAPPTRREPETVLQPARREAKPAPVTAARAPGRGLLMAGAAVLLVAAAAGVLLLRQTTVDPPAPRAFRVPVRSTPAGAAVLVDGRETGLVTDGELSLLPETPPRVTLTFRKEGYTDAARVVSLPMAEGESVSVALSPTAAALVHVAVVSEPPGATVTVDGRRLEGTTPLDLSLDPAAGHRIALALEGHAPREVAVSAGKVPPEIKVSLVPNGPLATVEVQSVYPVDVLWRGKTLARAQVSPRVSLPAGRHTLTLVSGTYFLRSNVTVEARGGAAASVEAPRLGRVSIRAIPDNCEVFIDGAFADYPPILDRAIAAGPHTVAFKWPDGVRRQEEADVPPGALVYVMGRKE